VSASGQKGSAERGVYCVPVVSIRLKSEPSVALLVLDVVVGLFSLQSALETGNPFWIRAVCVLVALLAWLMAIREALMLVQRRRQVPR
jgi:hypothetical protein